MRLCLLSFAVLLVAACSSSGHGDLSGTGGAIDVVAGTYGGVGLDATASDVEEAFGAPLERDGPAAPVAANRFRGPTQIPLPKPLQDLDPPLEEMPPMLRYDDVAFLTDGETVFAVLVEAPSARTEEGVAIGDALSEAIEAYDLRCETVVGSNQDDLYRACFGRAAPKRYVWFGGDPIANISIGRVPLTG